jgi:uncharacterized protein (DUF362 family)
MTTVVISEVDNSVEAGLERVFAAFGGIESLIPRNGGTICIKPNGVHFSPHSYTHPDVLAALLAYLRDHGYRRLAVMESSTGGNFTRLVFRINGYARICRRYGVKQVYLDEGPTVEVDLCDDSRIRISRYLYDNIINRGENFYLNLPKLKTHSMAQLTLGVKNQQAFPIDADRMHHHNHETLHRRLAALFALTQPDFCIVEGLFSTAHGHIPTQAFLDECLVPMNILIGGKDTLAVDAVGARVLGYSIDEVEHLRLCAKWGLGEADLAKINIQGVPLQTFTKRLPHTLLGRLHPDVRWVNGRIRACQEGCRGNSENLQEMLTHDQHGRGGWTLVCGSGFNDEGLDELPGDILVVGRCACEEVGAKLRQDYAGRDVYLVPERNDLMSNTRYQTRMMGIKPLQMVPLNPLSVVWNLLLAKLHGLNARIPPLLG